MIPKDIRKAIEDNQLIIFCGAGLSKKFSLPTWSEMVKEIINESDKNEYKPFIPLLEQGIMSPIQILEHLKQEHVTVKRFIKDNFQIKVTDKKQFELHKKLIDLSGKIITTNYDNAFELASDNKIIPSVYTSDYNINEINKGDKDYIFKIHGTFNEPDNCIIFKEQYENLYNNDTAAKQKLKNIFSEKTILFIGFSFNDPDIELIFNKLDKAFSNNNKHFAITTNPEKLNHLNFLQTIQIKDHSEVNEFIDLCLNIKSQSTLKNGEETNNNLIPKIAILSPSPLDIKLNIDFNKIINCFNNLTSELHIGTLNTKTLELIEDFDLLVIISKTFKSKLYIESDDLKNELITPLEIINSIPNDNIPIVFISDEKLELTNNHKTVNISSLRSAVIKKFIFKAFQEGRIDFKETEVTISDGLAKFKKLEKGKSVITSLYGNNRDLDIGKKCLSEVIGRIEEQSVIASKLLSIYTSNKLLNIKASGGTGKTTLVKKVAYELYIRGLYSEGVNFISCENVKSFDDFEEVLLNGFNLMNILDFKNYLIDNFSNNKLDLLIILDNFETVVNTLDQTSLDRAISLLKFATDYASIVVTSRERISFKDDFEDFYTLTPMTTDDALELFERNYGAVSELDEIRILREDILEDLLNNNPLAIQLVTKSRTKFPHISQLRTQLKNHFFESTTIDYSQIYVAKADLNIERTKSIFQSINYSYETLNSRERIAFELLSLFPDGISLSNFKKCFVKKSSDNNISDYEFRSLRDKSLIEDYNGNLQLQPIIRRFSDYQFQKREQKAKEYYCTDAYKYNSFILEVIDLIEHKKTTSEALKLYNFYKNNLLKVLDYIPNIILSEKSNIPEKKYLLNYIYGLEGYIINEKQIREFKSKLNQVKKYFNDLPNAETFLDVIRHNKSYYFKEFDDSYAQLSKYLTPKEMEERIFDNEDLLEKRYKSIISNIHSMEGYTLPRIKSFITNNNYSKFLDAHFFYMGITESISEKNYGFYHYEYRLMHNKLEERDLEDYIKSLHSELHLEIMQSTYTLSKIKLVSKERIQKLVISNPYTSGLKSLMLAFVENNKEEKTNRFEEALNNLSHIKYYYLEALYYYCLFLRESHHITFKAKLEEGLSLSKKFYYQYCYFLFKNIENPNNKNYSCDYNFYPVKGIKEYVITHNEKWSEVFNSHDL